MPPQRKYFFVTNVLQNIAKLDFYGGGCYDKGKYVDIFVYQNKVNK